MKLKTYQAYTMAEALGAVRKDLGSAAVILNTRTFKRGGLLGLRRKTIVEVTATVPQGADAPAKSPTKAASSTRVTSSHTHGMTRSRTTGAATARTAAAQRAYAKPSKPHPAEPAQHAEHESDAKLTDQERTRRFAQRLLADQLGEGMEAARDELIEDTEETLTHAAAVGTESIGEPSPSSAADPPGRVRRFVLQPEGAQILRTQNAERGPAASSLATAPQMQEELSAIRDMVGRVLQQQTRGGHAATPTMPAQLFDMYLKLVGQEISEELADRIVNDVRDELTVEQLHDEQLVKDAVMRHLADYIPTAMHAVPTESPDDRPLTIALIGPTGVGKTTTLAKLAATFKLRHQRRVGLVTADTYRIAAVEQLRTYANIIGLPIEVVLTPAEMRQAMHKLSDCDVVLIDTAGRSQNDASRIEELKQNIRAADPHEVHLVLSSAASEKVLIREAEAFSEVGMDKIVLTKLDEAVSFGMLVNVIRQLGKELSFVTTGQEVPDHIEQGRPERLAQLVMGGSVHS